MSIESELWVVNYPEGCSTHSSLGLAPNSYYAKRLLYHLELQNFLCVDVMLSKLNHQKQGWSIRRKGEDYQI